MADVTIIGSIECRREMRKTADAVIIGGGVMGCSTLYHLAGLGMKNVVLLDQNVLGSGSTGRSQAILRMHYSNPVTSGMAWESLKIFKDFDRMVGHPSGYTKTGYVLVVGSGDITALEEIVSMQRRLGIDTVLVSPGDLDNVAPMLNVDDVAGIAYEPQSGYADPYLVTSGYALRAQELGSQICTRTSVTGVVISGGRVKAVTTNRGTIETPIVLVAAGPWSKGILNNIGFELPLETSRHQVIMIRRPEGLLPDHPIVGDVIQEMSVRPDRSGLTIIGVGEEPVDLHDYDQGVDQATVHKVLDRLVNRMPAMSEGYFRGGWSGLFAVTPDWHPIMGPIMETDGLYCAVGFSGHGFKLSPMIGLCMAELIAEGKASAFDISPFRASRFDEGRLMRSKYRYKVLA